jgi:hypothetical protein
MRKEKSTQIMIKFPRQRTKYDFSNVCKKYKKLLAKADIYKNWPKERAVNKLTESRVPDTFKFVNGLPWKDGDFSDKNSCFWGGRNVVREILKEQGVKALQLYKNDKGIGRALVLPINNRDNYLLFNVYGYPSYLESFVVEFLKEYWEVNCSSTDTFNSLDKMEENIIYTNGNAGWIYPSMPETLDVDLHIDVNNIEEYFCMSCDAEFYEKREIKQIKCPYCKKNKKVVNLDKVICTQAQLDKCM